MLGVAVSLPYCVLSTFVSLPYSIAAGGSVTTVICVDCARVFSLPRFHDVSCVDGGKPGCVRYTELVTVHPPIHSALFIVPRNKACRIIR